MTVFTPSLRGGTGHLDEIRVALSIISVSVLAKLMMLRQRWRLGDLSPLFKAFCFDPMVSLLLFKISQKRSPAMQ